MQDDLKDTVTDYYSRKHEMEPEIAFEQNFPRQVINRSWARKFYFSGIAVCLLAGVVVVQVQYRGNTASLDSPQLTSKKNFESTELADNSSREVPAQIRLSTQQSGDLVGTISGAKPDSPFDRLLIPGIDLLTQTEEKPNGPYVGWCLVEFTITETGLVVDATVVESEPPGEYDAQALDEISGFLFDPKIVDGVAVPVHNVQYVFKYRAPSQ